ncbi:MAG: primosomal protein N' [Tannerellaceae bacterium]|jgi:primosomal protein N' (replication factor Y)|nr:primosomal protein N' [Tannerellaceae bacterium]
MCETLVEALLPVPVPGRFLYRLPAGVSQSVQAGCRVTVPFGRSRVCTALVTEVRRGAAPEGVQLKDVMAVLDEHPVVRPLQVRFWQWLADYYLCSCGEVYKAAVPGGGKGFVFAGKKGGEVFESGGTVVLSAAQEAAFAGIRESFRTKEVCLLHGVTSGGKTEIYARLIAETLSRGEQALYLLPEIAVTAQLTVRLRRLFGDRLLAYHSKFSDKDRSAVWSTLLSDDSPRVVLGVRSALFLPFSHLGLVVVDEEHETSYKQQDPAPRYHARSAATVLASMHGAKTLLGSATPSLETYHNATTGKYGLVELKVRYGDSLLPHIVTVDVRDERRRKVMRHPLFSPLLIDRMREGLSAGEQVILFQNRRGFSPWVECQGCGWSPHCAHCDVSLTYHKGSGRLVCHYCGYSVSMPTRCPECGAGELRTPGFGTEKVEEETSALFPSARIARLDVDTARTRASYERILTGFSRGEADILIGTQMIAKGLDFGKVSTVGILSADSLMNYPDFRAHERAFQLMTQVGGRAGRRHSRGVVIVQTSQSSHPLIRMVEESDYVAMASSQLSERRMFHYPPYYRLLTLVLRSRQEDKLESFAAAYGARLRTSLGERVLGPVPPVITRLQRLHIRHIVLKTETSASPSQLRRLLSSVRKEMRSHPASGQVTVHYDVDV